MSIPRGGTRTSIPGWYTTLGMRINGRSLTEGKADEGSGSWAQKDPEVTSSGCFTGWIPAFCDDWIGSHILYINPLSCHRLKRQAGKIRIRRINRSLLRDFFVLLHRSSTFFSSPDLITIRTTDGIIVRIDLKKICWVSRCKRKGVKVWEGSGWDKEAWRAWSYKYKKHPPVLVITYSVSTTIPG